MTPPHHDCHDFCRDIDVLAASTPAGHVYDGHAIGMFQSVVGREAKQLVFIFTTGVRQNDLQSFNTFADQ
jgi:hypothetical protein